MAKILTRSERLKKGYSNLYNLNQKLKNISTLYYIADDGCVYMKSLVPFLETVVYLRYPDIYEDYKYALVTPNKFFDFGKQAKKSKLEIEEIHDEDGVRFVFSQYDREDLRYTLNIVKNTPESMREKLEYKRLFEINDTSKYKVYDDPYFPLKDDQVEDLCNAKYLEITLPDDSQIPLTKQLFLDIKKGDGIQLVKVARQKIPGDENKYRSFYMIRHDTDLYTSYTVFNRVTS